jgi:hypothetical protein
MPLRKPPKNFLEMIPVRNVGEYDQEGDKITLFIPKFKSEWMRRWFIPANRSKYFSIHLDELGSKVWNLIDGEKNTEEICDQFSQSLSMPEEDNSNPSLELRVTEFLRQLYKNRFIIFKQS